MLIDMPPETEIVAGVPVDMFSGALANLNPTSCGQIIHVSANLTLEEAEQLLDERQEAEATEEKLQDAPVVETERVFDPANISDEIYLMFLDNTIEGEDRWDCALHVARGSVYNTYDALEVLSTNYHGDPDVDLAQYERPSVSLN